MVASDTLLRHASSNFFAGLSGPAPVARVGKTHELCDSTANSPPSSCAGWACGVAEGASGSFAGALCCAALAIGNRQQMAGVKMKRHLAALQLFRNTLSPRLKAPTILPAICPYYRSEEHT